MIKAAAVALDITPPIGGKMSGYMARTKPSQGIHDPLEAQVLLIESEKTAFFLVTLDLLAVQKDFTNRLRDQVKNELGIPADCVLVVCSHTHSGPEGFLPGIVLLQEEEDPLLFEITLRKVVGACRWAMDLLQPVKLSFGSDWGYGIGLNRNDPQQGSVDQEVSVLRVDNIQGIPIAVLFHYGCHPTVMGAQNTLLSADFPGAARRCLREVFPSTVFMFANGAAGDVSTRFTRHSSSFEEVERLGQIVGSAVVRAMHTSNELKGEQIKGHTVPVDLPLKAFPSDDEAEAIIHSLQLEMEQMRKEEKPQGDLRKIITKIEGAELLKKQAELYGNQKSIPAELQCIQVGELFLAGIPGEPFSKTILDIKEEIKPKLAVLIGYANDYKGYFPESKPGLPSTYEDYISPFSSDAALVIKKNIVQLIEELK